MIERIGQLDLIASAVAEGMGRRFEEAAEAVARTFQGGYLLEQIFDIPVPGISGHVFFDVARQASARKYFSRNVLDRKEPAEKRNEILLAAQKSSPKHLAT
nr:hypothetical protein [Sinorhizobium meliloti]